MAGQANADEPVVVWRGTEPAHGYEVQCTKGKDEGIYMAATLEQTGELMRRSQGMINQAVDRGTTMLADRVEHYTNVAHDVGEVLRDRGEAQAADFVDSLAGRVQGVATYLRRSDGTQMWTDAQEAARGRTWVLAGVGFVAGVAAARAVRTAASSRTWESNEPYVDAYADDNDYAMRNTGAR
jgi:hypothetical protein